MSRRQILQAAGVALAAVLFFLIALWSPARQVRLHQEGLLDAISDRDWKRLGPFIADDYSDRWGHDKGNVLETAGVAFGQFVFLKITLEDPAVNVTGEAGRVISRLNVGGKGGPLAEAVIAAAGDLREPFTFDWQQRSWKPWDWTLVRMEQRELRIPDM